RGQIPTGGRIVSGERHDAQSGISSRACARRIVAWAGHRAVRRMPGMPGSPGMGGSPFGAPQQPPPARQAPISIREEVAKHGAALLAAAKKKAPPEQLCKLFKVFTAAEAKMVKALDERKSTCGVPAEV